MKAFVSASLMQKIDEATLKSRGLSSFELMSEVSEAMTRELMKEKGAFLFLCGPGNNGGDGWATAERLRALQREVVVVEVMTPTSPDGIRAKKQFRGLKRLLKTPEDFLEIFQRLQWEGDLAKSHQSGSVVIVDAIFGNGARHPLPDLVQALLKGVNRVKGARRVALDIPSGLAAKSIGSMHKKSGRLAEEVVVSSDPFKAHLTLTVAYPKEIFLSEKASAFLGECRVVGQRFASAPDHLPLQMIEKSDFVTFEPRASGHKGLFGKCGLLGGSSKTPSAPLLAAEAAARVGAGYVSLFFADSRCPRLTLERLGFLYPQKWTCRDFENQTAMVMGCGGFSSRAKSWLRSKRFPFLPLVIDAEALAVAHLRPRGSLTLVTPHLGEAVKMIKGEARKVTKGGGRKIVEIEARKLASSSFEARIEILQSLLHTTGHSVYLKGAPGLLTFALHDPQNHDHRGLGRYPLGAAKIYVNLSINPIFSKAGSGDILAGIMGGFLAQFFARGHESIDMSQRHPLFKTAVINALLLQQEVGECLRGQKATMVTDQLRVLKQAFKALI